MRVIETIEDYKLEVASVRLVKDIPIYSDCQLTSPYEVVKVFGETMCEFDREVVGVINLRPDLKPINVSFVSIGILTECMTHPREILKVSILSNASNILLVHSHPSGNLVPSEADVKLTDKMIKICSLIGIGFVDHVIVGGNNENFFSFRSKGIIKTSKISLKTDFHNLKFEKIG